MTDWNALLDDLRERLSAGSGEPAPEVPHLAFTAGDSEFLEGMRAARTFQELVGLESVAEEGPGEGELWAVTGAIPPCVLITRRDETLLRACVATRDVWVAGHEDMILSGASTPTSDAYALLLASDGPIPRSCLAKRIGLIAQDQLRAIWLRLQHALTGDLELRPTATVPRDDVDGVVEASPTLLRWRISDPETGLSGEFLTGPRLHPADTRSVGREEILAAAAWLVADGIADLEESAVDVTEGAAEQTPSLWERVLAALLPELRPENQTPGGFESELAPGFRSLAMSDPGQKALVSAMAMSFSDGVVVELELGLDEDGLNVVAVAISQSGQPVEGIELLVKLAPAPNGSRFTSSTGADGIGRLASIVVDDETGVTIEVRHGSEKRSLAF